MSEREVIITFGKYEGRSWESVAKEDPKYIYWIAGHPGLAQKLPEGIYSLAKTHLPVLSLKSKMPNGKYRGRLLEEVIKEDFQYAIWYADLPDTKVDSEVRKKLSFE